MAVEVILTDNFPDIIRYTHIQCVAYGALAHHLNAFWRANTADVVVTVLRLWRIEWGEGIVYLFAIFNFIFRFFWFVFLLSILLYRWFQLCYKHGRWF